MAVSGTVNDGARIKDLIQWPEHRDSGTDGQHGRGHDVEHLEQWVE